MTGIKDKERGALPKGLNEAPFAIEMRKGRRGGVLSVSHVVAVSDFKEDRIELVSKGGRMTVTGEALTLSLFDERSVEIYGRIKGIEIFYGKVK